MEFNCKYLMNLDFHQL